MENTTKFRQYPLLPAEWALLQALAAHPERCLENIEAMTDLLKKLPDNRALKKKERWARHCLLDTMRLLSIIAQAQPLSGEREAN
jgi:hypothetical protein